MRGLCQNFPADFYYTANTIRDIIFRDKGEVSYQETEMLLEEVSGMASYQVIELR